MGRTVRDVALMLQAIAGAGSEAPLGQPTTGRDFIGATAGGLPGGLRIAYSADPSGIGIDADIEAICRQAAMALVSTKAQVEEISLDLAFVRPAFLALRGLWFVTHLHSLLPESDRFGPNVANNVKAGLATTVAELAEAEQARGRLWTLCRELFERVDCVITPCMAVPPFPVEQNYPDTVAGKPMATYVDWIAPTFVWSMTGLTVVAVPAGLDSRGLPVGLQVIAPPYRDEMALIVAAAIERLRPIGRPSVGETTGS
jgi:amidase